MSNNRKIPATPTLIKIVILKFIIKKTLEACLLEHVDHRIQPLSVLRLMELGLHLKKTLLLK